MRQKLFVIAATMMLIFGGLTLVSLGSDDTPSGASSPDSADSINVQHSHHGSTSEPVAKRIAAAPDQVAFCASASLEPFEASMDQLISDGSLEATERFRRCLADTLLDHGDAEVMADLDSHSTHFIGCFDQLRARNDMTKERSVTDLATCVVLTVAQH